MKVHEATMRRVGRGLRWFLNCCLLCMDAAGMPAVMGLGMSFGMSLAVAAQAAPSAQPAPPASPSSLPTLAGDWLAPAEDADDVDAIVSLALSPQGWTVHIKAIRVTRADQRWRDESLCVACPGAAKAQPLKGLLIAWGGQARDGVLAAGQILDPSDGRVYGCDIQPSADGKTLRVLAYRGLKLLGHTMVWTRL